MYFTLPLTGFPLKLGIDARYQKKTRMMGLPDGKKVLRQVSHLDTILACDGQTHRRADRQTDGQTPQDDEDRTYICRSSCG